MCSNPVFLENTKPFIHTNYLYKLDFLSSFVTPPLRGEHCCSVATTAMKSVYQLSFERILRVTTITDGFNVMFSTIVVNLHFETRLDEDNELAC